MRSAAEKRIEKIGEERRDERRREERKRRIEKIGEDRGEERRREERRGKRRAERRGGMEKRRGVERRGEEKRGAQRTCDVDGSGQLEVGFSHSTEHGAVMHQPGDAVIHHQLLQVLVIQYISIHEGT